MKGLTDIFDQIETDEADIITPRDYGCYHGRGTVAGCAPGSLYLPYYWYSRYPRKISPTWNLVNIFAPMSWTFTFLSILSVSLFYLLSARIGVSHFGLQTFRLEIILSPFRSTLISNKFKLKILIIDFRVPLLNSSQSPQSRSFGFSSNMILLMWCVWGGFLLHILECNYLTVLVKPVYEKPVDTAEDIIERGITILDSPGRESSIEALKKSPYPLTRALAENTYVSQVVF